MTVKIPKFLIFLTRAVILAITAGLLFVLFFGENAADVELRSRDLRRMDLKDNEAYRAECGSCHLAYTPGLLPERSWVAIMANLADHFGLDAEVDTPINEEITAFLKQNAAEHGTQRSRKISNSIPLHETPLRFTETIFYSLKHGDLKDSIFSRQNIRSKSNCDSCHPRANLGEFLDRETRIPE